MEIITNERCTAYSKSGHPERPARVVETRRRLTEQQGLPLTWVEAEEVDEQLLLAVHPPEHLARMLLPEDYDPNTPWYPDIDLAARLSAGAAQQVLATVLAGGSAFSLMRPPGHHALPRRAMGFCYLANAAVTALAARATGLERVAVYDFDVHHGNGTEEILVDRAGLTFASVHRSPGFPHTGLQHRGENCRNHLVRPHAPRKIYRDALARALDDVAASSPELLIVSAGFDAHVTDPVGKECLEEEDFNWLGGQLRGLGLPTCHLLEGGYSDALPELVLAYLRGFEGC